MNILIALMLFYRTATGEITGAGPIEGATLPAGQTAMSISQAEFDAFQARALQGEVPKIVDGAIIYSAPAPQPMPSGVETPVLVLRAQDGAGVGVVADGLDLVTYLDHASPRPDDATLSNRVAAARLARATLRDTLRTVRVNMATNINETQAISVTSTSSTAQVRSAVIDLRRELIDTQQELQRLRSAVADIVRGD